jgi:hypothetical protein
MQTKLIFTILLLLTVNYCFANILPARLQSFGVLAYTTVTNSGSSIIGTPSSNADIGLYPGTSVTGFPPGVNNGVMEVTTPKAQLAQGDVTTAYNQIANTACTTTLTPSELAGRTFAPGVYCCASPVTLTGTMYLDTQNKTGPIWIFQFAQTFITAAASSVVFIGTPAPCNVFWNIGTSLTLGSTTNFMGVINAYASISLGTGASITGKCLAQTGAVTLLTNSLTNCVEQAPGVSMCFGLNSTSTAVCNNQNGTCVNTDTCVCRDGYAGSSCSGFTCFGVVGTMAGACTGNGTCTGPNTCTCNNGYGGMKCDSCKPGWSVVGGRCMTSSAEGLKIGALLAILVAVIQLFVL